MEPNLGLLAAGAGGGGSGVQGGGGNGLLSERAAMNMSKVEKDCMGTSEEAELELGLGLSLGGGGGAVAGKGSATWGECGRILTAKDFPNGFSAGIKRERAAAVSQVVGWPPIKSYRMNTLANQMKGSSVDEDGKGVDGKEEDENSKKKAKHGLGKSNINHTERAFLGFVKVNMDGLQIGRKVDLNAHQSYETLTRILDEMFFKPCSTSGGGNKQMKPSPNLLDASSEFVLTYEDKDGDWMLVGDVPWGMFVNTVRRLRIMNTSESNGNGLAPKL